MQCVFKTNQVKGSKEKLNGKEDKQMDIYWHFEVPMISILAYLREHEDVLKGKREMMILAVLRQWEILQIWAYV